MGFLPMETEEGGGCCCCWFGLAVAPRVGSAVRWGIAGVMLLLVRMGRGVDTVIGAAAAPVGDTKAAAVAVPSDEELLVVAVAVALALAVTVVVVVTLALEVIAVDNNLSSPSLRRRRRPSGSPSRRPADPKGQTKGRRERKVYLVSKKTPHHTHTPAHPAARITRHGLRHGLL